ncbi:MAG TPA: RDD family protein [Sulfurimonas sp.]|uniref:RDD family protein n=1 Tax=Sulfurimonas sp. TaxID=2022749 RepID=UPI002B5D056C|nr:RDD family protein [Sulfurimonas sp.]HUH43257.1 RDD family protein [Sulfurimonas sp.]
MEETDYEYAGFWVRVGASLIDLALLLMITLPLTLMIYGSDTVWNSEAMILGPADFLINYSLPFFATVIFWMYKSATPGKMVLQLKVLDEETGNKLTIGQSIGRYFAYIPAMLIFMIGIFWVAWDKKKQGWHDKLAKTVVVRNKKRVEDVKFT